VAARKLKQQTAAEKAAHEATAAERRALEKYRAKHAEKRSVKLKVSNSSGQLELAERRFSLRHSGQSTRNLSMAC
jgi:hypothetical protein